MKKRWILIPAILCVSLLLGCDSVQTAYTQEEPGETTEDVRAASEEAEDDVPVMTGEAEYVLPEEEYDLPEEEEAVEVSGTSQEDDLVIRFESDADPSTIPAYSGEPYVIVNDNVPFFEEYEYTTDPFENYSSLDELGRCGTAYANICKELMPTEERESISEVKPTGWHNNPYDFVEGGYLYNRCHIIAFELAGENANEKNLITGTRYFNVTGMLPFENMVADYVKETDHHVLYRVTPIFEGDNLVADGVLMEAYSVEDEGDGIEFCVFVYNVQPGVTIDYATGENWSDGSMDAAQEGEKAKTADASDEEGTYILNTSSMKFHKPDCTSVEKISASNREEYTGSRSQLIEKGYEPCGSCKP